MAVIVGDKRRPARRPGEIAPRNGDEVRARIAGWFADGAEQARKRASAEEVREVAAEVAFAYWQHKFDHPKALLDTKRLRIAVKRIRESGDNLGEIFWALDGARRDHYVMAEGRHAGDQRHDDFEFLLRDRASVEKYANLMPGYKKGEQHPRAKSFQEAITNGATEAVA